MYLVIIRSAMTAIAGLRLRWQKLRRTGDVTVESQPIAEPLVPSLVPHRIEARIGRPPAVPKPRARR
jgi:hypothetical protein